MCLVSDPDKVAQAGGFRFPGTAKWYSKALQNLSLLRSSNRHFNPYIAGAKSIFLTHTETHMATLTLTTFDFLLFWMCVF